jgi:hypothetical protein
VSGNRKEGEYEADGGGDWVVGEHMTESDWLSHFDINIWASQVRDFEF